jgi:exodeoxyribonuclease VII small subunit
VSNGASGVAGDDGLSYEQARAELAQIVGQLESGGQSLEESLALWTRGEELADRCQEWLTGAAARLEAALADSAEAAAAEAEATAGGQRNPAAAEPAELDEA